MNSVAQRQASYWGTPLNIEQLVKQVGMEMRAAKQQAQDLDHARTYLSSLLPADGSPARLPHGSGKEHAQQARSNGRVKPPRIDHSARFTDPPAPPPQQPLPEKPDSAKAGISGPSVFSGMLKREKTAKPLLNGVNSSPTGAPSSQIMSLLESLKEAQKQIESQGTKVKELEDMLRQERQAREAAEDKVKRLEQSASSKPIVVVDDEQRPTASEASDSDATQPTAPPDPRTESALQQRLDIMLSEMQAMQSNLEQTTKRADAAEAERSSLAEMIEKYRKERQEASTTFGAAADDAVESIPRAQPDLAQSVATVQDIRQANGHTRNPKFPAHLHQAVATALQQQQQGNGEVPAQYAPYVSMMGVVLLGVGIMAYLNSWQKVDK